MHINFVNKFQHVRNCNKTIPSSASQQNREPKGISFEPKAENNFITGQNFIIDGGMTKKMIYV